MECVLGFIDSIYVFKKAYTAQSLCKQENLARAPLYTDYIFHNAMEEVKILGKFVSLTKMKTNELTTHTFPPTAVQNQLRFNIEKTKNLTPLHSLVWKGVLIGIAEKVEGSGLNLGHLKKIFERDGEIAFHAKTVVVNHVLQILRKPLKKSFQN